MSMPEEGGRIEPEDIGRTDLQYYKTERIIASATVAWVVILTTYMIFQNGELSYTSVYFLKIILSLSGAVMLATLPGFFDISYTLSGFSVRAAGGAAAFVFIYTQSPNIPAMNAQPAPAPPAIEQTGEPGTTRLSPAIEGYPVLFAMSISPGSYAPAYQSYPAQGSGPDWRASVETPGFAATYRDRLAELVARAAEWLRAAMSYARSWLDEAARLLRAYVDPLLDSLKRLLGLGEDAHKIEAINIFSDALPGRIDDLAGTLLHQSGSLTGSLFGTVSIVTSTLSGAVGQTLVTVISAAEELEHIVTLADETTQALIGGVHDTTSRLLHGTQTAAGRITDALNSATGGLTEPAGEVADGVLGAAGEVTDRVLPLASETTGGVFGSLNKGLSAITDGLNEISPEIVSRLAPDFAAPGGPEGLRDSSLLNAAGPLLDSLPGQALLQGHLADHVPAHGLLEGPVRPLVQDGPVCIAGCSPGDNQPLALGGLVNDRLSGGLGVATGALSNVLSGSGDTLGRGQDGGAPGAGPEKGGLISSTVKTTGSILNGAAKGLGRR